MGQDPASAQVCLDMVILTLAIICIFAFKKYSPVIQPALANQKLSFQKLFILSSFNTTYYSKVFVSSAHFMLRVFSTGYGLRVTMIFMVRVLHEFGALHWSMLVDSGGYDNLPPTHNNYVSDCILRAHIRYAIYVHVIYRHLAMVRLSSTDANHPELRGNGPGGTIPETSPGTSWYHGSQQSVLASSYLPRVRHNCGYRPQT